MIYELIDGQRIEGETLSDIVAGMAQEKFDEPRSMQSYRKASADRVQEIYGLEVRFDTDENFIQDLIHAELIKRID